MPFLPSGRGTGTHGCDAAYRDQAHGWPSERRLGELWENGRYRDAKSATHEHPRPVWRRTMSKRARKRRDRKKKGANHGRKPNA